MLEGVMQQLKLATDVKEMLQVEEDIAGNISMKYYILNIIIKKINLNSCK